METQDKIGEEKRCKWDQECKETIGKTGTPEKCNGSHGGEIGPVRDKPAECSREDQHGNDKKSGFHLFHNYKFIKHLKIKTATEKLFFGEQHTCCCHKGFSVAKITNS